MPIPPETVEESWVLTGKLRNSLFLLRRRRHTRGQLTHVKADAGWAFTREDEHGDIAGFAHTHPFGGTLRPSTRDDQTMNTWVRALGKPLVCLISNGYQSIVWIYYPDGHIETREVVGDLLGFLLIQGEDDDTHL